MSFAVEPVPAGLDSDLAEYLYRQLNAIQIAVARDFVAPRVTVLPDRPMIGAIVYLGGQTTASNNGFYGCIENSQGVGEWKKIQAA